MIMQHRAHPHKQDGANGSGIQIKQNRRFAEAGSWQGEDLVTCHRPSELTSHIRGKSDSPSTSKRLNVLVRLRLSEQYRLQPSITTIDHISSIDIFLSVNLWYGPLFDSITFHYTDIPNMNEADDMLAAEALVQLAILSSESSRPNSSRASSHTLVKSPPPPQDRSEASRVCPLFRSDSCRTPDMSQISSKTCMCYERKSRRRYSIGHNMTPHSLESTKASLRPHLKRL